VKLSAECEEPIPNSDPAAALLSRSRGTT
jgi:hypothetical protein